MKSTNRELERIKHVYINKVVEARAINNFDEKIEIFGKIVGPFKAGNHYKMEFWIAKAFMKRNILETIDEEKLDLQKIQKIAYTESRSQKINAVDPFLFTSIRQQLEILDSRIRYNHAKEKDFRQYISNIEDLIIARHRKIINLSQMKQSVRILQNLTKEEKVLMSKLSNNFGNWNDYFLEDVRVMHK